jgi:nucleoside-diphosphate-sugar epimerase
MKILVTGGGGFLGKAICRQLLARGEQVTAFQRSASEDLQQQGARVIRGDIGDAESLHKALEGMDAVIHTAAKAGLSVNYDEYFRPNVIGTDNVISGCLKHAIRKLVFTSSPSVTHADGDIEGGDESLPYAKHYNSPYPATKALAEQRVMQANCADKLIDTVYIDNAANSHLLALDALQKKPDTVAGKTYFISNDEPRSQARIIGGLLEAAGLKVDIQSISPGIAIAAGTIIESAWKLLSLKSDPPITRWSAEHLSTAHWYDISAAKRDLGYQPGISIDEGLKILAVSFSLPTANPA